MVCDVSDTSAGVLEWLENSLLNVQKTSSINILFPNLMYYVDS